MKLGSVAMKNLPYYVLITILFLTGNTLMCMFFPMPGDPFLWCCFRRKLYSNEFKQKALLNMINQHQKLLTSQKTPLNQTMESDKTAATTNVKSSTEQESTSIQLTTKLPTVPNRSPKR